MIPIIMLGLALNCSFLSEIKSKTTRKNCVTTTLSCDPILQLTTNFQSAKKIPYCFFCLIVSHWTSWGMNSQKTVVV